MKGRRNTAVRRPGDGGSGLTVVLIAAVVGVLSGLIGAAFHLLLDAAASGRELLRHALEGRGAPGWLVLMPLCALLVAVAARLVVGLAPEAAGSGIQEVEGVLAGVRYMHWRRLLPVKFFAGALGIGSGLVLGREGPTVHMGSALGAALADQLRLPADEARTLLAAGAGAGLAAAFNAPLAGIIFVTEEMRSEFNYNFVSLYSVIAASCMSVIVNDRWLGMGPSLPVQNVPLAPLGLAPVFLLLGVAIGGVGVGFNRLLLRAVTLLGPLRRRHGALTGAVIGAVGGALLWFLPDAVGGGETVVATFVTARGTLPFLLGLFALRLVTTAGSYGAGVPGGIFAPMLALGTIAGVAFGAVATDLLPGIPLTPGMFAVAAMGALFASTVGAPLTGIVLVLELTGAHAALLTITLTCLSAALTARACGGRPIYRQLLQVALRATPELSRQPPTSAVGTVTEQRPD
jgi:H+/Cl- antiporter ClcA